MQQHFFRLNITKRAKDAFTVILCLSLLLPSFSFASSRAEPSSVVPSFNTQSLAEAPQAFTWEPLTRGLVAGLGGLLRRAEIPAYWLFKRQKPTPLFYRIAHLFSEKWISRRTAVAIGFFGIGVESFGLKWLIHQHSSLSAVFFIAAAGALLHGILRIFDRDMERRRLPFYYVGAQFASLALYGWMILVPFPMIIPIGVYLYAQLKHFAPKWHPTTGAEARLYAAGLEKDKNGDIDFIGKIFVPRTKKQWWSYIHLMNVPVKELLDDLEKFERGSRPYKLTMIALRLNHRLVEFPLLQERYDVWIQKGLHEKAEDLIGLMLGMQYTGLLQKQEAGGQVRSPVINKRTYRGRYPEALEILVDSLLHFREQGETGPLHVQDYGVSDGSSVLDLIDRLTGHVKNVTIEALDNVMSFSIVKGLYKRGRYADYTFIFKSDGQLIHALSPTEGRFWIRWMLTIYMPPKMRIVIDYVITFMTGIQFDEWRMPIKDIEEQWKRFKGEYQRVSTVRPDLAQYAKESQKDPRLVLKEADVFKDPQERPARSKHVIMVNGLLPRTNEYFGPQKIKTALSELGRTLVEGGILINAMRGSLYYPDKLYMDVYQRIGNNLVLIHTEGYSEAEWREKETWHGDERWRNRYWLVIPVASDTSDESSSHASPPTDGIRPLLLRA